jgi:peptidyl-prolyl cis-trans isomerase C
MKLITYLATGTATLFIGACSQSPQSEAPGSASGALGSASVATVNGEAVPESLFRYYVLSGLQKNADDLSDEERQQVTQNLIDLKLVEQAAEERGLPEERTIAAQLELQRLQTVARSMISRYLEENPATESELRSAYEENLSRFTATQYKASHILLKTEDEAKDVISELDKGADFAELAKERSTGPTASKGGDLGYFTADSMVKPFGDAVKGMEVGTYTHDPVQTQFGWHVIELVDIKSQEAPGLDAVRKDVETIVSRQKVDSLIASLKEKATITTN